MARLVSSVPLSETIVVGRPRSAMTASSSRATRKPGNEVSAASVAACRYRARRCAKSSAATRRSSSTLLRGRGYDGAHDSVHRFVKAWRDERARVPVHAFVPMSFAPGEAYQFDWSHETITLQNLPLTIKAAHMKLSQSRMPFLLVYFRETQELVFDAHDKAFQFYGGSAGAASTTT